MAAIVYKYETHDPRDDHFRVIVPRIELGKAREHLAKLKDIFPEGILAHDTFTVRNSTWMVTE